jgi:FixJ family two-component response regulator
MTNRPNLTEEEKEHYNKVAMDLINKDIDLELSVSVLTKTLKDVQQEKDEAIRLATLFQTLYLRLGKTEDEHYNTVMVQGAAKSLAELKGLKYFGDEA